MSYSVTCDCGQTIAVRAGDAGAQRICSCGTSVAIPSLGILRETAESRPDAKQKAESLSPAVLFGVMFALVLAVGFFSKPFLIPLGLLISLAARWWFAGLIFREMSLGNALMVFFIPFMPTLFLIKRFDVAWKPFFFGICGFIIAAVGAATLPY